MKTLSLNSLWFTIAITLNALGNSFMVTSNLGSAPWTSAAENLEHLLPLSVGACIIILYFVAMLLSYIMKIKFTVGIIVKTIALSVIFGVFIDLFLYLHQIVYVPNDIGIRYLYLFIGLNLIAVAICIYFQSSSVYLPSDYLLKAFGKLMNNYTVGTIVCTAIPLSISIIIIIYRQSIDGVGSGTLLFMFGMGLLIDFYNRWIVINKTPEKVNQIS